MQQLSELQLLSKNDIPFEPSKVIIHTPTCKQIGLFSEDIFWMGCQYLNFSKNNLKEQDKKRLEKLSDFEVLMTIIKNNDIAMKKNKTCMQLVLLLLFPEYKVDFLPTSIMLSRQQEDNTRESHLLDKDNYSQFKEILKEIFCLTQVTGDTDKYNPGGPQAKALVQKFKKRQKKLAELKNRGKQKQTISIISQYISILSVGQKKDMNKLLQYTVYQLFDEFRRFRLKEQYDLYVKAKMAGAKDLEEIENWMGDIHSDTL